MARTSQANVALIIEIDDGDDLTAFISVANEMVTELCTNSGYSDTRLELIERWLSAHFYTNYKPRAKAEKAATVSETKQDATDLGLNSSFYGQTAMRLDTAGSLASHDKAVVDGNAGTPAFIFLGTLTDEQESLLDLT